MSGIFWGAFVFAFIRIGQYVDRKRSGRERGGGTGSGTVCKPGLELGTPEAQQRYMKFMEYKIFYINMYSICGKF